MLDGATGLFLPLESAGMIRLMGVTKLSISMDAELAELVKQAAADDGVTVSAWLMTAAANRIRNRLLGDALEAAHLDVGLLDDSEIDRLVAEVHARAVQIEPTVGA